jgi:hypothetical protein
MISVTASTTSTGRQKPCREQSGIRSGGRPRQRSALRKCQVHLRGYRSGFLPTHTRSSLEQVGRTWLIPVLAEVPVERLGADHCAAVFERVERINAEIAARSDGNRAYVRVDGDVRSRPSLMGVATQHRIYAAQREFCNFEVRKTRRMAFNPVYAIELEPEQRPEAKR